MESEDFDIETHRKQLVDRVLDGYSERAREPGHDVHDALSETVFEVIDTWQMHATVDEAMAVLEESPNEPDEWKPYVRDETQWREVIKGMAYTVVKQDAYDALERESYLDEHWMPTDKLRTLGTAEV